MITNKLITKMFIRLVPNNLFQVAVLQLFADKGIINKYNRKENSYKNQYFCTEQAKVIYDFWKHSPYSNQKQVHPIFRVLTI